MKNNQVKLYSWTSYDDVIDIDWPKVQKKIGKDHLSWLLDQDRDKCQLIVARKEEDLDLVVEFYNDKLFKIYRTLWPQ